MSALILVLAYVIGSIPCAYIAAKIAGGDLHRVGSRNPGAMNAIRNVGAVPGLIGGVCDVLKGVLVVWLAVWIGAGEWVVLGAGLLAIAGHNWSIWLRGTGGKGLAVSAGVLVSLYGAAAGWLVVVALIATMVIRDTMTAIAVAVALAPVLLWLATGQASAAAFGAGLAVLTLLKLQQDLRSFSAGRRRLM